MTDFRNKTDMVSLLLATVALIAMAGCGGGISSKQREAGHGETVYSTSSGAAAAMLSKLKTPSGFALRGRCALGNTGYTICFTHQPSIVLSKKQIKEIIRGSGAQAETRSVKCTLAGRYATKPRVGLVACNARATLSDDHLLVIARSLVVVVGRKEFATSQSVPGVSPGTMIEVTDVGH